MLISLIPNKIYYKIFDLSFANSSHIYSKCKIQEVADLDKINHNIQSILSELSAKNILILQQVHSNIVCDADLMPDFSTEPIADAAVTTIANLALAIQTADCVPVLLSDIEGKVIGAIHCGWRGAKANIINNVVTMMHSKGASSPINAVIGPAIQSYSYEVSKQYYDDFVSEHSSYAQFFTSSAKAGCFMFDLPAFVMMQLRQVGVADIIKIDDDTYTMFEKYPSYRRSCHLGQRYSQSILSTIMIK